MIPLSLMFSWVDACLRDAFLEFLCTAVFALTGVGVVQEGPRAMAKPMAVPNVARFRWRGLECRAQIGEKCLRQGIVPHLRIGRARGKRRGGSTQACKKRHITSWDCHLRDRCGSQTMA